MHPSARFAAPSVATIARGRVRARWWAGLALAAGITVLLAGPRARVGATPASPALGPDVETYLRAREDSVADLRSGDGKRIVWADPSNPGRTPVAFVYLHGFSADPHEVEPLLSMLGSRVGANVFFQRLAGHGRDGPAMGEVEAADWLADALEAVAVGERLGDRVVLVGTSTGGTLATWAAARDGPRDRLAALVLMSPNFHPADPASRLLLWPWGGWIARVVVGRERCFETLNARHARHWTECYPTRALLPMMALVERVRTSDLSRVRVPALVLYSPEDRVVDPRATEDVFARLGSELKALVPVSDPGDPERHVLAGDILSPSTTDGVARRILEFLDAAGAGIEFRASER